MKLRPPFSILLVAVLLAQACTTISPFSETAYRMATGLKAESLTLMAKATDDYSDHAKEAEALKLEASKAFEYAKGRPLNSDSTQQWAIIIDPAGNSLGGFLVRWERQKKLSAVYVEEERKLIGEHFDLVSELESGKSKPKKE